MLFADSYGFPEHRHLLFCGLLGIPEILQELLSIFPFEDQSQLYWTCHLQCLWFRYERCRILIFGQAQLLRAVAISRSQPRGWTGRVYEPLAPSWRLVQAAKSGAVDEDEYIRRYQEEVLSKLDPGRVFAELGEDAILLCWENSGAFCHRRLVAEWLEENLGVSVPEVGGGGADDRGQTKLGEW
jgi:uncharacterized protein YeaO (DUF488 family)